MEIVEGGKAATIVGESYPLHLFATDQNHNLRDVIVDWGGGSEAVIKTTADDEVSEEEANLRVEHIYNQGVFSLG